MDDLILQSAQLKLDFNKALDLKILDLSKDATLSNNDFLTKRDELFKMQVILTEHEQQILKLNNVL